MGELRRVCVFCGSSPGARPEYRESARALAAAMVERGIGLVYGGGNVGLMGTVADAVLAAGGTAVGVIPEGLLAREVGHAGLTELHVVASMHQRKALMADLSDAFVALPGGFGTLEEFCEVLTWTQLGIHRKACGLLNVAGFYDGLLTFFDRAVDEAFVRPHHRENVLHDTDPRRLLDRIAAFDPPAVPKWIGRAER